MTEFEQVTRVRVHYPRSAGRLALRCDRDWESDIAPIREHEAGAEFLMPMDGPFRYYKPVLSNGHGPVWAVGDNLLALGGRNAPHDVYPYFSPDEGCSACDLHEIADPASGRRHAFRVFYPPGYYENAVARYPVLYMQDGQNVFFPDEAFLGRHWRIPETLSVLDAMNAIGKTIVVGVYPNERERDYTQPGYVDYGRFLVHTLKPYIDQHYRTLTEPQYTAVMGSSLGGVVSFYLGWQYPHVFSMAGCMSSTFTWRDDLMRRVAREPKRAVTLYLDSGWPRDNYEVTRSMRALLRRRGYTEGVDLHYYAFPEALHNEQYWAMRCHLPLQLFFDHMRAPVPREPHATVTGVIGP